MLYMLEDICFLQADEFHYYFLAASLTLSVLLLSNDDNAKDQ